VLLAPRSPRLSTAFCIALLALSPQQRSEHGTVSGTLKTPAGAPAAGVRIGLIAVPDATAKPSEASVYVSFAETDKQGRYRLDSVPPGRYYLTAGQVASPTYYPAGLNRESATVLAVPQGTALSGYDFTFVPSPQPAVPARGGGTVVVNGRIVADDGNPLPAVPLRVVLRPNGGGPTSVLPLAGSFQTRITADEYEVSLEGLPLGYALKSIAYGNTAVPSGPVRLDGSTGRDLLLTLAVTPLAAIQGVKVSGKVTNTAKEWDIANRILRLQSAFPNGPTLETSLKGDSTFEFPKVPAGIYKATIGGLLEGVVSFPSLTVAANDVGDVTIDLRNNPFPDYPDGAYTPVLDARNFTTVSGVVTQVGTQSRPSAPAHYLRLDVKDETSGAVTPWAVMLTTRSSASTLNNTLNIAVGATITVTGLRPKDGSHRLTIDRLNGTINGIAIPDSLNP